jgi:hypothetical protein
MYSDSSGVRWIDAAATQGIVTMNYNRYWDLHLCSSTFTAEDKQDPKYNFFTHRGTEYRYDFLGDMQRQGDYREAKAEGYESGAWATLMSRANARVLDSSELTHSQKSFLQLSQKGGISEELSRLRYVGCLVSIERLSDGNTYPQLQSLVQWISDANTINKLRINCHGSGKSTGGFNMGGQLSPDQLVAALCRHGLTAAPKAVQNLAGLAHAARWKRDNEVNKCEKCEKQFTVMRRRHHCRRCGGIFCDLCSSWKVDLAIALAGESNKTVTNVRNARVCQQCFSDAMVAALTAKDLHGPVPLPVRKLEGNETLYGLKQITLGLCMGAKSDKDSARKFYSAETGRAITHATAQAGHDGFVAGSLAQRLLQALRGSQLHGIKVTASNQVVSGSTGEIENTLGVEYPVDTRFAQVATAYRSFAGQTTFNFPAVIWGTSQILKNKWDAKKTVDPQNLPTSPDIVMHGDRRSLAFGATDANNVAFGWLQSDFLHKWGFSGWVLTPHIIYSAPSPGAKIRYDTMRITPPDRVTEVKVSLDNNNNSRVYLTGRQGQELFKDYKSYGVS